MTIRQKIQDLIAEYRVVDPAGRARLYLSPADADTVLSGGDPINLGRGIFVVQSGRVESGKPVIKPIGGLHA